MSVIFICVFEDLTDTKGTMFTEPIVDWNLPTIISN